MPGFVIRISCPLRTSVSISSDGCEMSASVKSSLTAPLVTRTSIRRGTTQRPSRLVLPLPHSMRPTSLGSGTATPAGGTGGTGVLAAGRSVVSTAKSAYVRAVSAASSRWSSSSAVSRPSPAATRSTSTTRSRSW